MVLSLSIIMCLFTMRPLSVSFYLYVITHQVKTAKFAILIFEDEEDGYPWDLY